MKFINILVLAFVVAISSCVSKKKYYDAYALSVYSDAQYQDLKRKVSANNKNCENLYRDVVRLKRDSIRMDSIIQTLTKGNAPAASAAAATKAKEEVKATDEVKPAEEQKADETQKAPEQPVVAPAETPKPADEVKPAEAPKAPEEKAPEKPKAEEPKTP